MPTGRFEENTPGNPRITWLNNTVLDNLKSCSVTLTEAVVDAYNWLLRRLLAGTDAMYALSVVQARLDGAYMTESSALFQVY